MTPSRQAHLLGRTLHSPRGQLSQPRLTPVSVWMKRLAVLQVTRHCDLPYCQNCHSELAESREKVRSALNRKSQWW